MDEDTPLAIGAGFEVSDRLDADGDLRVTFPARLRVDYFSRADVERLRDHLTALLTEPTPSVELVEGREYRLLPGARCSGSSVPESCFFGVTRVTLETKPDLDGDVQVTFLDGRPSYVGSRGWWVLSRFLAPLDEPKPVKVEVEVGKEYRLLPDARNAYGRSGIADMGATRVRVDSGPDGDGDHSVTALDGKGAPASGFYVCGDYLAPLDEPVAAPSVAQAAREVAQMYRTATAPTGDLRRVYAHIGEAFATLADKLEGKPE